VIAIAIVVPAAAVVARAVIGVEEVEVHGENLGPRRVSSNVKH
jgi:hypothetical protein